MCFAPQLRALFRHPNLQKWREHAVFCTFIFGNLLRATTAYTFSTSEPPKKWREHVVFCYILTSKCASRHNGVHLFRHLNFQKWSNAGVFCAFWLQNVLRATTAVHIATSKSGPRMVCFCKKTKFWLQNVLRASNGVHFFDIATSKVVRTWWVLYILGEAHLEVKIVQNTPGPVSDHFWKLRCRKSARRCGAKHISKSKCTKHTRFGPLLEVEMSKKCTLLWREANFQVKMYKAHQVRTTFGSWDVEKVHAVVARSTFRSQNVQSTRGLDHFWTFGVRMLKKCTPLWREAHFEVKMYKTPTCSRHFWRFRCRFASLRVIAIHYTPLHYSTLHYTTLHNTTTTTTELQNYTPTLHYTPLHSTTLHYIKLQYTTPHYTTLHYTTLHYTTLYTPLHYTTLHYTIHSTH